MIDSNMHQVAAFNSNDSLIKEIKQKRVLLHTVVEELKSLTSRLPVGKAESVLATRKLQECRHWLGETLRELGDAHPYPNGDKPENSIIDPMADIKKL